MTKREQLQKILDDLKSGGKLTDEKAKVLHIVHPDGRRIPLSSPEIIAAVEARIAALPPDE